MLRADIDKHAPLKSRTIRCQQAFHMNSEWRKINHKRNMIRNAKDKYPTAKKFESYRKLRNKSAKACQRSRQIYFQERCEGGPKNTHFWKTIKPFLSDNSSQNNDITLRENGHVISDSKQVGTVFNDYLANIAKDIGFNDPIPPHMGDDEILTITEKYSNHPSIVAIRNNINDQESWFDFVSISDEYVYWLLKGIDTKTSVGYDNISSKFLKCGAVSLTRSVTDLINMSTDQCLFPDNLKFGELSPLYNKGNDLQKENYRPVCILIAMSKIFERSMSDQMGTYCENIFSKFVSAFRRKYGYQSALVRMCDEWRISLDKGELVGSNAMDLSRAFDSVPHGLLIANFHTYGASTTACKLLARCLSNRFQRVKLNGDKNEWLAMTREFPQGSILGPLLFNIFFNDIFYFSEKCNPYKYADDNVCSVAGRDVSSIVSNLKSETQLLVKWFEHNSFQANPEKFQFMQIGSERSHYDNVEMTIKNSNVSAVPLIKFLGVNIDEHLKFKKHVSSMALKAGRQINALQRLLKYLHFKSRMAIYKSFILANFNYCPLVWMFVNKTDFDILEKVHERALRFIHNDFVSDKRLLLEQSKDISIRLVTIRCLALEVFKCMYGLSPSYIKDLVEMNMNSYDLRDNKKLVQSRVKTTLYGLRTIRYYGAHIQILRSPHMEYVARSI